MISDGCGVFFSVRSCARRSAELSILLRVFVPAHAMRCSMPTLPFTKRSRRTPPFYALKDELPILLAMVCG